MKKWPRRRSYYVRICGNLKRLSLYVGIYLLAIISYLSFPLAS